MFGLFDDVGATDVMAALKTGAFPPDIDEIPRPVGGRRLAGEGADGGREIGMQFGLERQQGIFFKRQDPGGVQVLAEVGHLPGRQVVGIDIPNQIPQAGS